MQHDLNQECTSVDHGGQLACMNTAETHFCGCSATVYGGPITATREKAGVASCPGAPPRPVCSVSNCGACVVQHDYYQDCAYDTNSKACMSTAKTHFCACSATVYFGPVKVGGQACPKPTELDSEMDTSFAESYHRVPPIEPLAPADEPPTDQSGLKPQAMLPPRQQTTYLNFQFGKRGQSSQSRRWDPTRSEQNY